MWMYGLYSKFGVVSRGETGEKCLACFLPFVSSILFRVPSRIIPFATSDLSLLELPS